MRVVIGHSMGGKTAMQLALQFPQRVEKLVVADMAPRAYAPAHDKIFAALLALDLPAFQTRQQIEEALAPEIPNLVLRRFLLKNLGRNAAGEFFWKINLRGLAKIICGLASRWRRRTVHQTGVVYPRRQIQIHQSGRRAADSRTVSVGTNPDACRGKPLGSRRPAGGIFAFTAGLLVTGQPVAFHIGLEKFSNLVHRY